MKDAPREKDGKQITSPISQISLYEKYGNLTRHQIHSPKPKTTMRLQASYVTWLVNDAEKGTNIDPQEAQETLKEHKAILRKAEERRQKIEADLAPWQARTRVKTDSAIS